MRLAPPSADRFHSLHGQVPLQRTVRRVVLCIATTAARIRACIPGRVTESQAENLAIDCYAPPHSTICAASELLLPSCRLRCVLQWPTRPRAKDLRAAHPSPESSDVRF